MSGLLGPKPRSTTDTRLNAIEVNQSAYGSPIALTYGKTRVPMTLGWYGDFKSEAHTTKQSGGKGGAKAGTNTTFTYSAAVLMMLGEGPVTGIGTVWSDKAQVSLSDLGLTLFTGAGGQAPWSYLTTNHPSEAIGYDHTAYVASGSFQLGGSASLPNLTFELKGLLPFNAGTIDDADPSAILADYCGSPHHGCGFPYLDTAISAAGTASYKAYCVAMGMFISPSERQQRQAADFIREMLAVTNSDCVWSAGVLKIKPLADASVTGNGRTYTPDLTPIFTFNDDDYLHEEGEDPVKVTRKSPAQRFNVVRVEFTNRANQYNLEPAEAKDANDIAINGDRVAPTVSLKCIQTASLARLVAQIILQNQLFVVNTYAFKVRADYSLLEPLDYVALNDSNLGLASKLVRINEVEDTEDDEFSIVAEEVLVGTASAPLYNWQGAAGYAANYNASPGSVSAPLMFNAPAMLVDTNGGYELWIAVSGAGALWGGCDVYMSLDNASYGYIGAIAGPARHGTLTAALASGASLDNANTLSVLLARTELGLVSGTSTDRDENRTLMYVDGEILSYQTATLSGPGAYNITSLRRGQYGSAIAAHASGTKFARIDGAIFRVPYDAGMVGKTAYFKFVSHNVYGGGWETLAAVPAYSKALTAANAGQLVPGEMTLVGRLATVVGDRAFKSSTAAAWDSDVYSVQAYKNGAFASARPAAGTLMVGLNTDPASDSSYTSIDFALYCTASVSSSSGNLEIYEGGAFRGIFSTYVAGDDLSVIYDGAVVRYLKNGAVLREVMAGPGYAFSLDTSFYSPGAAVSDLRFGPYGAAAPVLFNSRGNCIVSDSNAQKVGGSAAWDSDFYSIKGYASCHISFKANATTGELMAGLNADPLTDQNYTSIDYAWYCVAGGTLSIYESGSLVASYGTYTAATVLAITYDGATVTYWKDGVSQRTVSVSGLTLYADASFLTPGVGINSLRFGPTTNLAVADTAQIGVDAATEVIIVTDDSEGITNATPKAYCNITHAALPYDCRVVLTAVTSAFVARATPGFVSFYAKIVDANDNASEEYNSGAPNPTIGNSYVQQDVNLVTGLLTANLTMTVEKTYLVTAGTPMSYYLCVEALGINATSAMFNTKIKMEVIKR